MPRRVLPHSRAAAFANLTTRTEEGRLFHDYRRDLLSDWQPRPLSEPVEQMIDQLAMLALHMLLHDRRSLQRGYMMPRSSRDYLAFSGHRAKLLHEFYALAGKAPPSVEPEKPKPTALQEHLARRAAERAAAV